MHISQIKNALEKKILTLDLSKKPIQQLDAIGRALEAVSPVDDLLATPIANVNVFDVFLNPPSADASEREISEYRVSQKLYKDINASDHADVWHMGFIKAGIVALFMGIFISAYRNFRNAEKDSDFFCFRRLLESKNKEEIMRDMGPEDEFGYPILSAAAYFYSPDIPKCIRLQRQIFCYGGGRKRKQLNRLQDFLRKRISAKDTEEKILDNMFIVVINKLLVLLNKKFFESNGYNQFQRQPGSYALQFTNVYAEGVITEEKRTEFHIAAIRQELQTNKKTGCAGLVLTAISRASFIYWLLTFVFYFVPVGMVVGVTVPPLALAFAFFFIRLIYIVYSAGQNVHDDNVYDSSMAVRQVQQEEIFEQNSLGIRKRETFMHYLQPASVVSGIAFEKSRLKQEIDKLLGMRRLSQRHAIVRGFVDGCLFPFFCLWLFTDCFKLLAGLFVGASVTGPAAPAAFVIIFMVVSAVTLAWGIGHGIYCAIQAVKEQQAEYKNLENKFELLRSGLVDTQVDRAFADLSLYQCDRFIRRYNPGKPPWTRKKKFLSRALVVTKRLGTGSLVFRLVIWGSISGFVLVPAALVAPISMPFIICFALMFAAWYYHAYNVSSKFKQAGHVTDYLCQSQLIGKINKDLPAVQKKNTVNTAKILQRPSSLPLSMEAYEGKRRVLIEQKQASEGQLFRGRELTRCGLFNNVVPEQTKRRSESSLDSFCTRSLS